MKNKITFPMMMAICRRLRGSDPLWAEERIIGMRMAIPISDSTSSIMTEVMIPVVALDFSIFSPLRLIIVSPTAVDIMVSPQIMALL